ncbi:MAG: hypothetical protein ABIQ40_03235 [Bacteroidia bacterium]
MHAKRKRIQFLTFVNSLHLDDNDVKDFQNFCLANKRVLKTSNPHLHAGHFSKLRPTAEQLIGYFKCMVEYCENKDNMLPLSFRMDKLTFQKIMEEIVNLPGNNRR